MIEDIRTAGTDAAARLGAVGTLDELRALEPELTGKRAPLTLLKQRLGGLDPEERKAAGQALNEARATVERALAERRAALAADARRQRMEAERLDLTEFSSTRRRGRLHPVTRTIERLEDVFLGMGFSVAEGPEVETDWYNFEALNLPAAHPARSMWDTFYLHLGEPETVLLRTHTSPVQIRVMEAQEPPVYVIAPGRVYRRDTADATHLPVFHQIEGLVVDRGVTFGDLAGTIQEFTEAFFGPGFDSRLRPSYFPFTEPSAEFDIRRPDGTWLELGGCGMVHPNVLRAVGYDPEVWQGFAFGFGIDRLAASFHGVADLRDLFSNDIRVLEQLG